MPPPNRSSCCRSHVPEQHLLRPKSAGRYTTGNVALNVGSAPGEDVLHVPIEADRRSLIAGPSPLVRFAQSVPALATECISSFVSPTWTSEMPDSQRRLLQRPSPIHCFVGFFLSAAMVFLMNAIVGDPICQLPADVVHQPNHCNPAPGNMLFDSQHFSFGDFSQGVALDQLDRKMLHDFQTISDFDADDQERRYRSCTCLDLPQNSSTWRIAPGCREAFTLLRKTYVPVFGCQTNGLARS
jgi:hypothetical protein